MTRPPIRWQPDDGSAARSLTARQRQVLLLAANGNTNAAIGRRLGISRPTVDRHLSGIFRTLGASDRAQAVAIALAVGEIGVHQIHIPNEQREAAA
ncbi:helix-turn-helix transcriptional regulator [Streptomyces tuirus]|uniref:helix-turn-helix domain-containing protein n=1 Tax=Streptomyces tuirus TaxID=68278 RepID=UPI00342EF8E7